MLAVAVVLLILAARVAWHASQTSVGWDLIRHDWARTLATFAGIDRPALSAREPEDQARFWLNEVKRLGAANGTPNVAAGAAWMLDAPETGFLQRYFRAKKSLQGIPGLPLGAQIELEYDALGRAVDRFEEICHEQCSSLIEHATNGDSANVEMWRARALLLFRHDYIGPTVFKPRRPDWSSVLDECAKHDPENALYDYLAALSEWTISADYRWEQAGYFLEVRDEEGFERGNRRFAAGLEKPRLMFGTNGNADTVAFLENSSISRMDRLKAAEGRATGARAAKLLYSLLRWQDIRQSVQRRNGQFAAATTTLRETLHVARQVPETGNSADTITEPLVLRRWALANLADLAVASPDLFDASETNKIDADRREVRLELKIHNEVYERLKAKDRPQRGLTDTTAAGLAVITQPVAEILLLLALGFTILARLCGNGSQVGSVRVGILTHVAAWVAGLGMSYVVLGLCPAGIVSESVQTWVVRGMLSLPFLIAFIGLLCVLNRVFRVGFGQLIALLISSSIPWAVVFYWADILDLLIAVVGGLYAWGTLLISATLLAAGWLTVKADKAFLRRADISGGRKTWLAFVLQILIGLTVPLGATIAEFVEANLETKTWIQSRAWSEAQTLGLVVEGLQSGMHLETHPWLWSLLQWHAYSGLYVGLALSLLILTAWTSRRLSRTTEGGFRQVLRHEKLRCLRLIGTTAARSLVLAGAVVLVVYLATVPAAIDQGEASYQRDYTRLVDQAAARHEINAEIAAIRNDATLMTELRQKAEK